MARLGRYKTGKACLYLNKLADVDQEVLAGCVSHMREAYPPSGAQKP
ncbi:MAG: hypothetical protein Q7U11_06580 [Phenylobacterium sp.]|nr:hypothetical protein [Phenylobacterium sp.]